MEGIFSTDHQSDEIKNELHKIKSYEIKLLEIICFMNWASRFMILKYLKQLGSFGDS